MNGNLRKFCPELGTAQPQLVNSYIATVPIYPFLCWFEELSFLTLLGEEDQKISILEELLLIYKI